MQKNVLINRKQKKTVKIAETYHGVWFKKVQKIHGDLRLVDPKPSRPHESVPPIQVQDGRPLSFLSQLPVPSNLVSCSGKTTHTSLTLGFGSSTCLVFTSTGVSVSLFESCVHIIVMQN